MKTKAAERKGASDDRPVGDVLDFLRLVWRVDHALQQTSRRMEAELGISGPQRLTLRLIGRFPGITPGELARTLHLHPSSVTGLTSRLVARRLVSKRVDPRDRRRTTLLLSTRGRALDQEAAGTVEEAVARVMARTPRKELAATQAVLSRLAVTLEEARDGATG